MKSFQIKSALFTFLLALAILFTGCKNDHDHDPTPHQDNSATITITSPAEGSVVNAGQTVAITGTISAINTLHGYNIIIRRKSDNVEIFKKEVHDHAANLTISESWTVDAFTQHTDLELEVIATLDHDGKTASKKVNFHAMP